MFCPRCLVEFTQTHPLQKYCTPACQQRTAEKRWRESKGGAINIPALQRRYRTSNRKYHVLKSGARKRGLSFDLSKEQHANLVEQPCYWCGGELSPTGGGLDRLDNNQGYILANCVPCCKRCNNGKNDATVGDFLTWIRRIYERHGEERNG